MKSLTKDASMILHKETNLEIIPIIKEKLGGTKWGHHNLSTILVALCAQNKPQWKHTEYVLVFIQCIETVLQIYFGRIILTESEIELHS